LKISALVGGGENIWRARARKRRKKKRAGCGMGKGGPPAVADKKELQPAWIPLSPNSGTRRWSGKKKAVGNLRSKTDKGGPFRKKKGVKSGEK